MLTVAMQRGTTRRGLKQLHRVQRKLWQAEECLEATLIGPCSARGCCVGRRFADSRRMATVLGRSHSSSFSWKGLRWKQEASLVASWQGLAEAALVALPLRVSPER